MFGFRLSLMTTVLEEAVCVQSIPLLGKRVKTIKTIRMAVHKTKLDHRGLVE